MARQQNKDNEQITVLATGDPEERPLPPVDDAGTAVLVADATDKELPDAPPPEAVPVVKKYVVTKGGVVLNNGFRTTIKDGKVVDGLNFDLAHLQRQGIRLQRQETFEGDLITD
jgi:hypothetical protein